MAKFYLIKIFFIASLCLWLDDSIITDLSICWFVVSVYCASASHLNPHFKRNWNLANVLIKITTTFNRKAFPFTIAIILIFQSVNSNIFNEIFPIVQNFLSFSFSLLVFFFANFAQNFTLYVCVCFNFSRNLCKFCVNFHQIFIIFIEKIEKIPFKLTLSGYRRNCCEIFA